MLMKLLHNVRFSLNPDKLPHWFLLLGSIACTIEAQQSIGRHFRRKSIYRVDTKKPVIGSVLPMDRDCEMTPVGESIATKLVLKGTLA
jgi:hypothetical protein